MNKNLFQNATREIEPLLEIDKTASFILFVQKESGEIPWSPGGKTDIWDHVESAMGLTVAGFFKETEKAYRWAASCQLEDGSFWSEYRDGKPAEDAYKDANMTAYLSVGLFHYFLSTLDYGFLKELWPCIEGALEFTLKMQAPEGQIFWAMGKNGRIEKRALLTGSSSIFLSLMCGSAIAGILGRKKPAWIEAAARLKEAIRRNPSLFDPTKARFSMDWYYPVLCGAVTGSEAIKRIHQKWDIFTIPGWGVRCVSDQPWLTMAETAELVITLSSMDSLETAKTVYAWLMDKQYGDGSFWTGVTYPDRIIYTEEKTTWTSAAVLLATDALFGLTPSRKIFSHRYWKDKS